MPPGQPAGCQRYKPNAGGVSRPLAHEGSHFRPMLANTRSPAAAEIQPRPLWHPAPQTYVPGPASDRARGKVLLETTQACLKRFFRYQVQT